MVPCPPRKYTTCLTTASLDSLDQRNRNPLGRPIPSAQYVSPILNKYRITVAKHLSPFPARAPDTIELPHDLEAQKIGADIILIVGWGNASQDPGFGGSVDNTSIKAKIVNLIASVRTLMRSTYTILYSAAKATTLGLRNSLYVRSKRKKEPLNDMLITKKTAIQVLGSGQELTITVPLIGINTLIIVYELILG